MAQFSQTIQTLNDGRTETELSLRLQDLIQRVRETRKKGKLTLTLNVGLYKDNPNQIVISDDLKITEPQEKQSGDTFLFYSEKDGTLRTVMSQQMVFQFGPAPLESAATQITEGEKQ